MKFFIVLAALVAAASASLIASPVVGYNSYGLAGAPLVSSRVYSPVSAGLVSPLGYGVHGVQQVAAARLVSPVATRYVSPVATRYVSGAVPVVAGVRSYAPVASYGLHSAPLLSHGVPSLYSGVLAKTA